MENKSDRAEAKSPWKTRTPRKPKTPKVEDSSSVQSYPKSPSSPTKQLEFSTPNKAEGMVSAPTPRRSARKSIKPIQEYENIVAQKGLKSTARTTAYDEDPADEGKWIPAVIGRVSSKRGKKLGRGKSKHSKRQRRLTEDSEASNAEDCDGVIEMENPDAIKEDQKQIITEAITEENDEICTGIDAQENEAEKNQVKQDADMQESGESERDSHNRKGKVNKKPAPKEDMEYALENGESQDEGTETIDGKQDSESIEAKNVSLKNRESTLETERKSKGDSKNSTEEKIPLETESEKQSCNDDHELKQEICSTHGTPTACNIDIDESEKGQDVGKSQTTNDLDSKEAEQCQEKIKSVEQPGESLDCLFTDERLEAQQTKESEIKSKEKSDQNLGLKKLARQEAVNFVDAEENSMESGDVELLTMPITADDSPVKFKIEPHTTSTDQSTKTRSLDVSVSENVDDSDCIMLSLNESSNTDELETVSTKAAKSNKLNVSSNSTDMPSLLVCSDDEEEETCNTVDRSIERVQLNQGDKSPKLDGTFDADQTPQKATIEEEKSTKALRPSMSHVPTPFKLKVPMIPDILIEPEEDIHGDEPPIVVEVVKEARIKSSRKRSFSACEDRPKRNVTFYSPANVTVSIYDGDLINSCKKDGPSKKDTNRKRSLSVTETEKEMITYIKQKKTPDTPESKKKQHQPGSRTKMPNFSAIHQQQFKRMESISDHVARKAERAKVLSNSALKAKPASTIKGISHKNTVLRDCNKDGKTNLPMPKARQRIELSGIEHKKPEQTGWLNVGMKIRSKSRNDLSALDDLPSIDRLFKFNSSSCVLSATLKPKLPKPKMETTVAKTNKTQDLQSKTVGIATTAAIGVTAKDTRPKFNLSTAPASQSFRSTETLDDRRKRLIDMYKSRNQPRTLEKNREILKGVRTNRRFELQMMSRNRPN